MSFDTFKDLLASTAERHGYTAAALAAQAEAESGWNPRARSPVGAQGLMQFMPATWREWGKGLDPYDPAASLDAGTRYIKWLVEQFADGKHLDVAELAWASYNCGLSRVRKAILRTGRTDWEGVKPALPAETQGYVARIKRLLPKFQNIFGGALGQVRAAATSPWSAVLLLLAVGALLVRRLGVWA